MHRRERAATSPWSRRRASDAREVTRDRRDAGCPRGRACRRCCSSRWRSARSRSRAARSSAAWSGGGFGMFSTTDVWARRHLHADAADARRAPRARRTARAARARGPRARAAERVAPARSRAPAARRRRRADDAGDAVSLTVYATRFDPSTLAPSGALLNAAAVRAARRDAVSGLARRLLRELDTRAARGARAAPHAGGAAARAGRQAPGRAR